MITGAFANKNGLADTLVKATPLLLVGLGIVIAYRAKVVNIGAEGQLIVGALLSTFLAIELGDVLPGFVVIMICLAAGSLAGALWGGIPGLLKARLNVNEILSTIMMNSIAIQVGFFLLRGPMIDPAEVAAGTNIPHSARTPKVTDLPRFTDIAKWLGFTESAQDLGLTGLGKELYGLLVEPTRMHIGFIFAIVMAVLVYILLWRTTIGYRIRMVGLNPHAARYAGINVPRYMILSMALSGALAGLAGAVEIVGLHHRMFEPLAVSAGYGFSGIVVALFAKLHPLGAIPSSILFGGLLVGGDKMQRAIQVPQVFITRTDDSSNYHRSGPFRYSAGDAVSLCRHWRNFCPTFRCVKFGSRGHDVDGGIQRLLRCIYHRQSTVGVVGCCACWSLDGARHGLYLGYTQG
jgi:simple sugar transport system permease protein